MKIKELFNKTVLDKNANEIGKISDATFDNETGEIKTFDINLKKNILDNNNIKEIDFNDVATFGQYIILSIEITDKE
ncbi:MAG: PRC-barrel domain-containing protein [Methanobrevibacter sp.]|nr:PRC-barrel domain-containing protein [Methanobrevibacter sp.]